MRPRVEFPHQADRARVSLGLSMSRERTTTRRRESGARKLSRPRSSSKHNGSGTMLEDAQVSVGNFLRSAREALRMTQAQVAEKTLESPWRLSRAAVSAIERGQNFPGLEAMLALSNVLYIDPKELIERARLTAVVPVDMTGLTDQELESRAGQLFWAGDFKRALAVYDAMAHKLALEGTGEGRGRLPAGHAGDPARDDAQAAGCSDLGHRLGRARDLALGVAAQDPGRGLRRAGRPASPARAPAAGAGRRRARHRTGHARQPRAADLGLPGQGQDALPGRRLRGRQGRVSGSPASGRGFIRITRTSRTSPETWLSAACRSARPNEARRWIDQAVALAREHKQPALEGNWLVESGKIALAGGDSEEAERTGPGRAEDRATPRAPADHVLRGVAALPCGPADSAGRARTKDTSALLHDLFQRLDEHEGVDEIVDYKETMLRSREGGRET